jgi:hypothetical protein
MIVIDTISYDLPIKVVSRTASSLFKVAERTADGNLHTETIGWFYNFEVEVGQSANNAVDYAALWVKLTEPVESHEITMPNEGGDLTFECYFAGISDTVFKWNEGGVNYFKNLKFSVIAISPARIPL